ncbi:MAG TPA: DNA replication/repair protein RecF [Acidimicrobiales bacterium]|nr:DNA replication/repair protein RecF [Acidimicrobiales bacterium]
MRVNWLAIRDFRNYTQARLDLAAHGLTVVIGENGQGKTNLLEALGWLATLSSFRGVTNEALVRQGATNAYVRAEVERDGRTMLLEAEVPLRGAPRVLVNGNALRRSADLLGALRVSVFSPDDLALVKAGPTHRRQLLDDALVALAPRHAETIASVERVLKQRGALLRQAGGKATPEVVSTLDVWDAKLAEHGAALVTARRELVIRLEPMVAKAYATVATGAAAIGLRYAPSWADDSNDDNLDERAALHAALTKARSDDLRRGVTTIGPHRDELDLHIGSLPARTHASQGEQRSLALALRLAIHDAVTETTGSPPILLLDDVFSELDPQRSSALVAALPAGQALLTTAGHLPEGASPAATVTIVDGRISAQ